MFIDVWNGWKHHDLDQDAAEAGIAKWIGVDRPELEAAVKEYFVNAEYKFFTEGVVAMVLYMLGRRGLNELHDGYTPLICAAGYGPAALVTELLDRGADPSIRNECGYHALFATLWECNKSAFNVLVDRVVDVDLEGSEGNTALSLAAVPSDDHYARRLLEKGADPHHRNMHGQTPIDRAETDERRALLRGQPQ